MSKERKREGESPAGWLAGWLAHALRLRSKGGSVRGSSLRPPARLAFTRPNKSACFVIIGPFAGWGPRRGLAWSKKRGGTCPTGEPRPVSRTPGAPFCTPPLKSPSSYLPSFPCPRCLLPFGGPGQRGQQGSETCRIGARRAARRPTSRPASQPPRRTFWNPLRPKAPL